MFIKKDDFNYLEILCGGLDKISENNFLNVLANKISGKAGVDILQKISVVGDEIFDQRGVDPKEWVTRTMIKRAFKEAKKNHKKGGN